MAREGQDEESGVGAKGQGVGGLFVEMGGLEEEGEEKGVVRAKNRDMHFCGEDWYAAEWRFGRGMVEMGKEEEEEVWWEVRYHVKGPQKDYTSTTRYTRM